MDAVPPPNRKLFRAVAAFSSTSLRKILLPGLYRAWKNFPKNRLNAPDPTSPPLCPLHSHPTTSMHDAHTGGPVLNLVPMTFSDSKNDATNAVFAISAQSPTQSSKDIDTGRGNNNTCVVLAQDSSKSKKRYRGSLPSPLSHYNLGERDGGRRPGFSLRLGRAARGSKQFKRRLAQALNTFASPLEEHEKSMTDSEMTPTLGGETKLESNCPNDLTSPCWNKYHCLDTTCGLILDPPTPITENAFSNPSCTPALVHTNLQLLMDARHLPPEPGDNRCSAKYVNRFGWSEDHKSPNIEISRGENEIAATKAIRYPVALSTDAVRGTIGLGRGLHVWRVDWPLRHRGTQAVVGVIRDPAEPNSTPTSQDAYRAEGYKPLVGARPNSWGWDLVTQRLFDGDIQHDHTSDNSLKTADLYPQIDNPASSSEPHVYVVLERGPDSGTLGYWSYGRYMGHAFRSPALKAVTDCPLTQNSKDLVYPIVSAVWGHCEMQLHYVDGIEDGPLSLKLLSRFVIRKKTHFLANIQARCPESAATTECQIDVPKQLLQYLLA